jgi:hypothetical protein
VSVQTGFKVRQEEGKGGRGEVIISKLSPFFLTSTHAWLNNWETKHCVYTLFFSNWIIGLLVGSLLQTGSRRKFFANS